MNSGFDDTAHIEARLIGWRELTPVRPLALPVRLCQVLLDQHIAKVKPIAQLDSAKQAPENLPTPRMQS
jgi:hypothetical protein